jgi:hypothetical protein
LGIISIDNVTNQYTPAQLSAGKTHVASIRYNFTALSAANPWVGSNCFEVYSPDGANWVNLLAADGPIVTALPVTVSKFKKYWTNANAGTVNWVQTAGGGATQPGPSTGLLSRVGYSLATLDVTGTGGFLGGATNGIALTLQFQTLLADAGLTMCVDSVNGKATVAWEWADAGPALDDRPNWNNGLGVSGPRCWELFEVPNLPPLWCKADGTPAGSDLEQDLDGNAVPFNHCAQGSFTLCATDPDPAQCNPPGTGAVVYSFAPGFETGYGSITGNQWTWSGPTVPQAANVDIQFLVEDACAAANAEPFTLHVTTTNNAPTIACPGTTTVSIETCKTVNVVTDDDDVCDALTVTVLPGHGADGAVNVTGNAIEFCPTALDGGLDITMVVQVSDGAATATCELVWHVIVGSPYQVELQKDSATIQGQYADLAIILHKFDPTQGLGGFDFLVTYDASVLAFQLAYEGEIYNQDTDDPPGCGWEFFTYRFSPYGNCGNACPSGMLRVIGMAESNNGPYHPDCGVENVPITLAYLRFLVSNDATLNCQYVPVRFFWYGCGDNTLSNDDGSELYLSEKVFDFCEYNNPFLGCEITGDDPFPTYQGAQDECVNDNPDLGKVAKRYVDFQNGGFDLVCADSIDARGDINLNGLVYEIADAVMFTNYFISGLSAFGTHIDGSIAASDTNADGLVLTVADLVYLIRVVIGDAVPYDKVSPVAAPVAANISVSKDGVFTVDGNMGAALVVVSGNVTPTLLASNMEMEYGFDGANTNILVYSDPYGEQIQSFSGSFLVADGQVVKTEFATETGTMVVAKVMPSDFSLSQNYPNPFNPSTKIDIAIPGAGIEWKLNIYNITGQLVESFSGVSRGFESVDWDASGVSSGVYFYKLTAGNFSDTKKAMLLK